MLLIIFGAGASYDSRWDLYPGMSREASEASAVRMTRSAIRPPLTADLFSNDIPAMRDAFQNYRRAQGLAGALQVAVTRGSLIEDALERYRDLSTKSEDIARQLLALQYSLRRGLLETCRLWHSEAGGQTKYAVLINYLDAIRAATDEEVILLTFNYDDLLERALESHGKAFATLPDYVEGPYPVFKVHGSVRWMRLSKESYRDASALSDDDIIDRAPPPSDAFRLADVHEEKGRVALPAIAIPTRSKTGLVMPAAHTRRLREFIPQVTRLLVVGWAAQDEHFLSFLEKAKFSPKRGLVVSDTQKSAQDTLRRLERHTVNSDMATAPIEDPAPDRYGDVAVHNDRVGFTGFIRAAHQLDELMGTNLGWPHPETDPPDPEPQVAFA